MSDMPEVAEIDLIQRCIPHRYPFLLIDRVEAMVRDSSAVGIKMVTFNEPQFQGHFPGAPILPGVMIVEAMAQTAAVMAMLSQDLIDTGALVYFMGIDKAKFRRKVGPGDKLELHVKTVRGGGSARVWKFEGRGLVDGEVAAQAEFTAMLDKRGS
ncbi:MAG TPA: 3-hydroxyacyl-ACP dehydratase FabZ [Aliiroseovarius sp.]|nr:3-hydroxyacyl-ACP dehydratase FabZ [Aliiroseovarius sp.]